MRDYWQKSWTPVGSRPHVLLPVDWDTEVYRLCEHYVNELHTWHPGAHKLMRSVHPYYRHARLAWVDVGTRHTSPESWQALTDALTIRVRQALPITLSASHAVAGTHAIAVRLARTPELQRLAELAGDALREVYGRQAPIHRLNRRARPHILIAVGITDDPHTRIGPLPLIHPPAATLVGHVVQADFDAWPVHRSTPYWKIATQRCIPGRSAALGRYGVPSVGQAVVSAALAHAEQSAPGAPRRCG